MDGAVTVIEASSEAQFLAFREKRVPDLEEVVPGVWSLPLPLLQLPIRYVNTYLLETADGPVLVDAGWPDEESWDALEAGMRRIGYGIEELTGLVVTHAHPDHHGLAQRIRAASGAWIAGHTLDAPPADTPSVEVLERDEYQDLTYAGMPAPFATSIASRLANAQQIEEIRGPQPDLLVSDGDLLPVPGGDLEAVWTPGHTSGHLCLWLRDRRLLITGDHVLPRISPAVGLNRANGGDPLGDYLRSLRRVAELPVDEVLPAHEYRFAGLSGRVDELLAHHEHRLDELRTVLGDGVPRTAWEIAQGLTWSRPWPEIQEWMQRAALLETLSHATLLQLRGDVAASDEAVRRWTLTAG